MAFYIQYRALCKRVKQQLDEFHDQEKAQNTSTPPRNLSGATTQAEQDASPNNNDKSSDDDTAQDSKSYPHASLPGITLQPDPQNPSQKYYLVSWESPTDPQNPRNWSTPSRLRTVTILIAIAFVVTAASSIDSGIAPQAAMDLNVSEVTEALGGTAIYLIGFGLGALLASPASEMVGRYPVYLGTLVIFGCWLVGAALAPNIGAQIAFRFLAGLCGSAPLTVAGGSMSDIWNAREKTWAFPLFAIVGFGGPVLGPVISSYIGVTHVLSWRWAEWVMLIADGLVIALILLAKRETLAPQLLLYKARHLRKVTGDDRFKTAAEADGHSLSKVLKTNFSRPFILALEPIVLLYTLYLTVVYIVLFTFLDGYTEIFMMTYGINQGLSNLCFLGLLVGILLSMVTVPLVVRITNKQLERDGDDGTGNMLNQETRIIFSMIGAPLIPIGLFWMGWTDHASISIWSPLVASAVVGFGIVSIFMSAYMYIIDSYQTYAASALTFVALVRYLAAGGMTVVGVPIIVVLPVPYVLYMYGDKVRARSKYAVGPNDK
ncbi:hypothetical protein PMZ80_003473 [Knufia obscura]|uniref:Major facilitator superfamily (MFS) profile domain-containing protein n=1 Tax=Knufia obscura TaxID=1635080 RepID=A0ABR0RUB6_9EURO|nr:hypothetical protein PMZ80_003473 [Knufia obscura]